MEPDYKKFPNFADFFEREEFIAYFEQASKVTKKMKKELKSMYDVSWKDLQQKVESSDASSNLEEETFEQKAKKHLEKSLLVIEQIEEDFAGMHTTQEFEDNSQFTI